MGFVHFLQCVCVRDGAGGMCMHVHMCSCVQFYLERKDCPWYTVKLIFQFLYQLQSAFNGRKCLYLSTVIYSEPCSNIHTI
jgi:hypothetical protein